MTEENLFISTYIQWANIAIESLCNKTIYFTALVLPLFPLPLFPIRFHKERPLKDLFAITLYIEVVQCCERLRQKGQIGRIPIKIQQRRRMLMRKFLDQQWMGGGFGGDSLQPNHYLFLPGLLSRTVGRYENLEGEIAKHDLVHQTYTKRKRISIVSYYQNNVGCCTLQAWKCTHCKLLQKWVPHAHRN